MLFFKNLIIKPLIIIFYFQIFVSFQPSFSYNHNFQYGESLSIDKMFRSDFVSNAAFYNDFVLNKPILKSYGPLILDINNLNYLSGVLLIPMINSNYKPLFLAINCKESIFNIKDNYKWRDWFIPFFTYELNILNDFCFFE